MSTRRNRQTGTRVTVYRDGPQWFTICEDHRQAAEHYTGRAARDWAAAPATWCTSCSEELDRRELDTVEPAEIIRPTWCTTCETVHAAACEPETLHPCRYGHLDCSTTPRGRCANEAASDALEAADNMNPHGIPRPSRVDLARAFLVRVADVLDVDDVDTAALATLVHALDTLETLEDPRAADLRDAVHNRARAIAAGGHGPAALETTGGRA